MRVEVLTELEEVSELRPQWHALLDRALDPSPFLQPEWLIPWWEAFSEPGWKMRFTTVWEGDELLCIAPLRESREKRFGQLRAEVRFWVNVWSNRIGLVVSARRSEEAIGALVDDVWPAGVAGPTAVLQWMVLESEVTQRLLAALRERGLAFGMDDAYASPYVRLPASWDQLVGGLSSAFRGTVRRRLRRADREKLTHRAIRGAEGLAEAMKVSRDSWQHASGTGIGSSEKIAQFYTAIAEEFGARGQFEVPLLYRDGVPTAFELNLIRGAAVYNLKVGYRQADRRLSPGGVLRQRVLEDAISAGFKEFDFMGLSERYKTEWTSNARRHDHLTVFPRGVVPRLSHALRYRLRPSLARSPLFQRLRGRKIARKMTSS